MGSAPGSRTGSSPRVVVLVGATASGKTSVAVEAARCVDIEVISADSRQVRAGMSIGTAAPTPEECAAVPHHLVAVAQPDESFTLVDWLEAAHAAIEGARARRRTPLVVGGTGQYVWALLDGWRVPRVPPNPALREALERVAAEEGRLALHSRLAERDPASAERIAPRNVPRVIRALEIIEATGQPVPPLTTQPPGFEWRCIGLRWPRQELYERVDRRVEAMFAGGLLDETRSLVERYGRRFQALRTIGYREALDVIDGHSTIEEAIHRTQRATHRLVRVQANWFREDDPRIEWCDGRDVGAAVAAIVAAARAPVP